MQGWNAYEVTCFDFVMNVIMPRYCVGTSVELIVSSRSCRLRTIRHSQSRTDANLSRCRHATSLSPSDPRKNSRLAPRVRVEGAHCEAEVLVSDRVHEGNPVVRLRERAQVLPERLEVTVVP